MVHKNEYLKKCVTNNSLLAILMILMITAACSKPTAQPDPIPNPDNIKINGVSHPTIKIGNQRWTAANYGGTGGLSIEPTKNRAGYGKLYSQEEAAAIVLPTDWRLPLPQDYRKLCTAIGILLPEKGNSEQTELINKLMSTDSAWIHGPGTNASSFNALPAGYIYVDLAVGQGLSAKLMTSEKIGMVRTYFHITKYPNSTTAGLRSVSTPESTGLRFVKDED